MEAPEKFESWAIVELMGHRRIAGRVTEQTIGSAALLRIDVPDCPAEPERQEGPYRYAAKEAIPAYTQFYGVASVYCLTPTTEEIARKVTLQQRERPVALFDVAPRVSPMLVASPDDSEGGDDPGDEETRW
jgi:hypothetical protein